ncbi:hypothetical protein CHARACLAT_030447 [Characodon lateralis]|uniref:Uncharacterized protein n=1 Tax=Characodon lateralis TaxID=208331 RepID=A0ABU7D644_9TELE|nr:hypothetical protein [Characodon lateralis]
MNHSIGSLDSCVESLFCEKVDLYQSVLLALTRFFHYLPAFNSIHLLVNSDSVSLSLLKKASPQHVAVTPICYHDGVLRLMHSVNFPLHTAFCMYLLVDSLFNLFQSFAIS